MVTISVVPEGADSAKARLSSILADAGAKSLAIVRGGDDDGDRLAKTVEARCKGFSWRRCVWVKDDGIIEAADAARWFGNSADVRGAVLSSVKHGRQRIGTLRSDATRGEADDALLAADAVRDDD